MSNEAAIELIQGGGAIADRLLQNNFDPSALRPFIAEDGRHYISRATQWDANGLPVHNSVAPLHNATATLRKDEWIHLDSAVVPVFRNRLRAVQDLLDRNLRYNMPNGMGHTVLQTQNQSDTNDAGVSMSAINESDNDRPLYDLTNLPLPIIHKDFQIPARELMVSRNIGTPIDTASAQIAARKVAEKAEALLTGTAGTYSFGSGTLYGYTNFTSRITRTITAPTASAWSQQTTYDDVLNMRQDAYDAKHYGPFMLYCSPAWDTYMDRKAIGTTVNQMTLRENIRSIEGIEDVRTLDNLDTSGAYVLVLVQMDTETVREIVGMDVTTVQWETQGGMMYNFKVMAIMVPQLRADYNGNTGIVHGTTA